MLFFKKTPRFLLAFLFLPFLQKIKKKIKHNEKEKKNIQKNNEKYLEKINWFKQRKNKTEQKLNEYLQEIVPNFSLSVTFAFLNIFFKYL